MLFEKCIGFVVRQTCGKFTKWHANTSPTLRHTVPTLQPLAKAHLISQLKANIEGDF